jgi:coproporphyrinogen III oxidase-like Fe-S oxidoreductase
LAEGFALEEFEKRFGFSFLSKYQKEVDSLIKDGLLYLEQKRVKPTDKGILLLDRILLALFK